MPGQRNKKSKMKVDPTQPLSAAEKWFVDAYFQLDQNVAKAYESMREATKHEPIDLAPGSAKQAGLRWLKSVQNHPYFLEKIEKKQEDMGWSQKISEKITKDIVAIALGEKAPPGKEEALPANLFAAIKAIEVLNRLTNLYPDQRVKIEAKVGATIENISPPQWISDLPSNINELESTTA